MRLMLAAAALLVSSAGAFAAEPKSGLDYTTLDAPQRADAGKKVEVIEFFMYHCPHCFALDPALSDWVRKEGERIVFRRVHLGDDPQARAFVTLEAMGKEEQLHDKIFRAIHVEHNRLNTDALLEDFIVKNGVDKAKYEEMFNSFAVQTRLKRNMQLAASLKVDSAPTMVIDGRYSTSPTQAGRPGQPEPAAQAATLQVADYLVTKSAKK
ncbi:MAG TPA: thiol:disulfide interchange protein DsbA/DsbL [Janthinobacterium sp.]|nr:thiol:disulfide interchange protein DsbA/DsbL [Janthinobacterium sp.]